MSTVRIALKKSLSCGFRPKNEKLYRIWNLMLVVIVGTLALLPCAVIALLLLVTSGRPIFYKGLRYGRGREVFNIIKFRTLIVDAEKAIGDVTVKDQSAYITPVGRFLRLTRLDELPQIWNVLRGDMNFFGPRPVRPIIAAKYESSIPNYNRRFEVKPGIVGHVQIFMPHGTSKRIRARYNNILVKRDVNLLGEISLVLFTAFRMLYLVGRPLVRRFRRKRPTMPATTIEFDGSAKHRRDKRMVVHISPSGQLVAVWDGKKPFRAKGTRIVFAKKNHLNAAVRVPVRLKKAEQTPADGKEMFNVYPETATGEFLIERHILSKSFAD